MGFLEDGYPDHAEYDIEPLLFAFGVLPIPHSIPLVVPIRTGRGVHASPTYYAVALIGAVQRRCLAGDGWRLSRMLYDCVRHGELVEWTLGVGGGLGDQRLEYRVLL